MSMNKKGAELAWNTMVIALVVVVVFLVFLGIFGPQMGKNKGAISEIEVMAACKNFYARHHTGNDSIDLDPLYSPICKGKNAVCGELQYCCDLYNDTITKEKDTSFIGCCIPEDKKIACPVQPKT